MFRTESVTYLSPTTQTGMEMSQGKFLAPVPMIHHGLPFPCPLLAISVGDIVMKPKLKLLKLLDFPAGQHHQFIDVSGHGTLIQNILTVGHVMSALEETTDVQLMTLE